MSGLFATLTAASAFFAALALFEPKTARPALKAVLKAGRWSPKTRPSFRARLRRA